MVGGIRMFPSFKLGVVSCGGRQNSDVHVLSIYLNKTLLMYKFISICHFSIHIFRQSTVLFILYLTLSICSLVPQSTRTSEHNAAFISDFTPAGRSFYQVIVEHNQ